MWVRQLYLYDDKAEAVELQIEEIDLLEQGCVLSPLLYTL